MLALQSIYREDDFDPVAYKAASRATELCALLMADEQSRASYEGMAKNNMQLVMYALVSRTQPTGGKLILWEEYTHYNIKTNVGLGDRDFVRDNPAYGFSNLDRVERRAE